MPASRFDLLLRAKEVKKQVDSGKLKGKALKLAKWKVSNYKWRAKNAKLPSRKAKHVLHKDQGFLPGFLPQMSLVRIEEIVADRIFKQLEMERVKKDIKKVVKTKAASVPRKARKAA